MNHLPAPSDLVLVAFIPSPKDFEIARLLGWYRIPYLKAPKVVAVDWLAFYQPASFGKDHQWQIEFVAPVKGHELALRCELFKDQQDHPRANDEYYKIQLGPLTRLPRSIPAANWKRLTFLYTTGKRLLTAETTKDLSVYDEERNVLWKALRERALSAQQYQVQELPELPIGPELLALFGMLGGVEDKE